MISRLGSRNTYNLFKFERRRQHSLNLLLKSILQPTNQSISPSSIPAETTSQQIKMQNEGDSMRFPALKFQQLNISLQEGLISLLIELMLVTLEDEIKKDRENDTYHRRDRRATYRNRKQEGYNHSYHDGYKRNYPQKKIYEDRLSPQKRQRSMIKISNLHYSVNREQLEKICSPFGKLKTCRIDWDKMGRSNETAIVEFFNRADEEKAMAALQGMKIEDQQISVEVVTHYSPVMAKKHHQINKSYGKYQGGKFYRRG